MAARRGLAGLRRAARAAARLAPDGTVTHNLQGSGEQYHFVTGAREHDGWLYLGSESHDVHSIARVRIPDQALG